MKHKLNSVDWTLIGLILFGILAFVGLVLRNEFLSGVALGWYAASLFWTYWIKYHEHKGQKQ